MEQPIEVRYTFIMLLAIADPTGRVVGTDVAIARRLNMPLDAFVNSVKQLGEPDPYSNSKEEDGRRVIPSDSERGYQLVNYTKYRNLKDEEEKREYMREYMRKRREDGSLRKTCKTVLNDVKNVTQAEAEAEAEEDKKEGGASLPPLSKEAEEIRLEWNKLPGLPQCQGVTPNRLKSIRARLGEPYFVDNWRSALVKIKQSSFCCGDNERGWRASFDWFLRPDVCVKVMEGKYDKATSQPTKSGGEATWKKIQALETELKQLDGLLYMHMDRERHPDKVARREAVRAELSKLKAVQ